MRITVCITIAYDTTFARDNVLTVGSDAMPHLLTLMGKSLLKLHARIVFNVLLRINILLYGFLPELVDQLQALFFWQTVEVRNL